MIDLDAIRERDRDAERCAECGYTRSGHRTDTLAECNRNLARASK